jgi:hypothetical protein
VRHALAGDVPGGLAVIHRATVAGADLRAFHRDLVEFLRAALLLKAGVTEALDYPALALEEIRTIAESSPWERLFRAVKLFGGATPRPGEISAALPLELALVECATPSPERTLTPPAPQAPQARTTVPPADAPPRSRAEAAPPSQVMQPVVAEEAMPPSQMTQPVVAKEAAPPSQASGEAVPKAIPPTEVTEQQWSAICGALKRVRGSKFVLGSLLLDCRQHYLEGDSLVLLFRNRANLDRLQEELQHPSSQQAIQEAVRTTLGRDYTLNLDVAESQSTGPRPQGHLLRAAMAMGATIVEEKEDHP